MKRPSCGEPFWDSMHILVRCGIYRGHKGNHVDVEKNNDGGAVVEDALVPIEAAILECLAGKYEPHNLEFIAKVFNVSRQRIQQIEQAAIHKLLGGLKSEI